MIYFFQHLISFTLFAGFPAIIVFWEKLPFAVINEFAPITQLGGVCDPFNIVTPFPTQVSLSIIIGAGPLITSPPNPYIICWSLSVI